MRAIWLPLLLIACVFVVLALLMRLGLLGQSDPTKWPFHVRSHILTAAEQLLYRRLVEALPGRIVLAQVQVSRVLAANTGVGASMWSKRLAGLTYDFVVCEPDTSVVAVVELDDTSNHKPRRRRRDERKARVSDAAGIPVLSWTARSIPDRRTIESAFASLPPRKASETVDNALDAADSAVTTTVTVWKTTQRS